MRITKVFSVALLLGMLLIVGNSARADILVATIDGCYNCLEFDTPGLTIHNPTAFSFTNIQIKLTGYQGVNNGVVNGPNSLPDMAGSTDQNVIWNGQFPGQKLWSYDYDDTAPGTGGGCDANFDPSLPASLCGNPGNFIVTWTAIWQNGGAGTPIFAQFSSADNATHAFVGWEGLDQAGYSETFFDSHTGPITGNLADIFVGTPPPIPEPASVALLGTALLAVGLFRRQKHS